MQKTHLSVFSGFFAAVAASALAAFGADPALRVTDNGESDIALCGFEGVEVGQAPSTGWTISADDEAVVAAYSEGEGYAGDAPKPFSGVGDNYLKVDASGEVTFAGDSSSSSAVTYIDTVVQIPATLANPADETAFDDAKFALWFSVEDDVTNLCVRGAKFTSSTTTEPATYKLPLAGVTGSWHRVTIDAYASIAPEAAPFAIPAFAVRFDGTYLFPGGAPCNVGVTVTVGDAYSKEFGDGVYIPAIGCNGTAGSIASVGFTGSGAVDDIVVTTIDPTVVPTVAFTLEWPSGLTAVSYQIGEGEPVSLEGETSPFAVPGLVDGAVVAFTFTNADGVTKTMTATASSSVNEIDASTATYVWADYLGDAVAGAYQIDDFADLDMLRKGVAAGLATTGETFKQTANIDMSSAGAFAGIGTYAKVPTAGVPFTGTYNGQGYTISNVTRAGGDTQGIFNQVGVGGVIENLVVENMVFASDVSGEYGFAIVGNAGGGATLRNLTATGVFGSADKPSTHNMAGIVVRVCGGATADVATTIDSCTNNATIYGGYTKLGGICAIVQQQTGFEAGKVVFVNCANNGMLVCKRTAADVTGNAGIVGYSSANNVELTGCYGNGVITNEDGANTDKDGALIGWQYTGYTLKDNGGNSAPANKKMIAYYGNVSNVTGFKYATVDNGVATTVLPPLTVGNTYLLEGNVAASATPVATLASGETISFDAALGYTFAGTVGAVAPLAAIPATSGTVTTYTAAITAATWIGGAQGEWEGAANWDGGFVPTKDTVVTFTNDAQVAIYRDSGHCKAIVLDGAYMTLVQAADQGDYNGGSVHLHFWGDEGRAVSGTGTLGVNNVSLFNANYSGSLVISADLAVLSDVTFKGNHRQGDWAAGSFTVTGETTVSNGATVKSIDSSLTTFQGDITVPASAAVTFDVVTSGMIDFDSGCTVTLVHPVNANDAKTKITLNKDNHYGSDYNVYGSVVTDAENCYVKNYVDTYVSSRTYYEVNRKRTVQNVTASDGLTVTGVTTGQRAAPGEVLTIGATGIAEGYEAVLTITKHEDSSVLVTTNELPFAYTMPDFDIDVEVEAVAPPVADPDPVDPGSSMTAEQMAAYPPVQIDGTDFTVHFVGQEGVTYQLVAADSCDLTEAQWKASPGVGVAKTTADANADGVIELSAPMGSDSAKFYKIRAYIAE